MNKLLKINIVKKVKDYTLDVLKGKIKLPKTTPKIGIYGFEGLINYFNKDSLLVINYIRKNNYINLKKMSDDLNIEEKELLNIINNFEHLKLFNIKRENNEIKKITCKYNKIEITCLLDYI